jgi:amino acid adenylation domain-containing protein
VADTDPAYVIYTSGSTGEPKGVVVEHRNLAASTAARRLAYPGSPTFLMVSPLAFDSSVAGIWGTLTAGGLLVVPDSTEVRDAERLVQLIELHAVTHVLCVPSLYQVVLDAVQRLGIERVRSLDTVIVAGEPLPEPLVRRHFAVHGNRVALVNEYGPTEATVWASYHRFTGPEPVSIGGPVPGSMLYVLDDGLRPVPTGVTGELFVGGAGVARGYLGRPDQTGAVFLADPNAVEKDARMYRTGDLVRWTEAGTLEFIGRRDHQVKIRGHRVELGAVEAAIQHIPGVRGAVVEPDDSHTTLLAFVVTSGELGSEPIRAELAELLPATLLPARILMLDRFPVSLNGKVDRAGLRALARQDGSEPAGAPEPSTVDVSAGDLTTRVAAAWAEVLNVPSVATDTNFFDAGGHSLTLFQLQNALERHTGHRPSIVSLFQHSTVCAQADFIASGELDGGATMQPAGGRRRIGVARARQQRTRQEIAR